ncbi:hypothetical protein Tsubulata_032327, partial [Turnera subulata]
MGHSEVLLKFHIGGGGGGGAFNRTHNSTEYVGGHVYEEYIVADELDLMVLLNGCKMNGHVKIEDVWYCVPGMCLHTAMKVVRMGDDSIMGLLDAASKYDVIDIYIQHGDTVHLLLRETPVEACQRLGYNEKGQRDGAANKEPIHEASVDGENEDSDEDGESVSEDSDAVVVTFVSSEESDGDDEGSDCHEDDEDEVAGNEDGEDEGAEDGDAENEVTRDMLAGKQDARNEVADNEVAENEVPGDMLTVNEDARNGN